MQLKINLIESFFGEKLLSSNTRIAPPPRKSRIRLNRNESAYELDKDIKGQILTEVETMEWKNYPPPYYKEVEELIAKYSGVKPEMVVPAAGSANIITTLLNYAGINRHQIVIARPSFSLYEFHCNTFGIPYETWWLDDNLEYNSALLPKLQENSIVLFASPNNPVGNSISVAELDYLLAEYPHTFFFVDEVYNEFSDISLTPLLDKYANLLLLRSFSKSFSAAGLRVGYLVAHPDVVSQVRKLVLPFSLNYLSMVFVKSILTNPDCLKKNKENIKAIVAEKNRVENSLKSLESYNDLFKLRSSKGNFILLFFSGEEKFQKIKKMLEKEDIELLDMSNVPMLERSLRLTIGKPNENDEIIKIFSRYK